MEESPLVKLGKQLGEDGVRFSDAIAQAEAKFDELSEFDCSIFMQSYDWGRDKRDALEEDSREE